MALETKCLTPDTNFTTIISGNKVESKMVLPFDLDITEKEAEILEKLIHNQMELILRSYFNESR